MGRLLEPYQVIRLNGSDHGWAVTLRFSGALAMFQRRLAIRLTEGAALALATRLNAGGPPRPVGYARRRTQRR